MVSQKEEVSLLVAHREFTMPVATGNSIDFVLFFNDFFFTITEY
jgi:hypothetical protein